MNTVPLRRPLVAMAMATVIGLIVTATPAAGASHGLSVTGGTATSSKTGVTESIDFGFSTTFCYATTLYADFGTEIAGGTFIVTHLNQSEIHTYSNGQFLTVITLSSVGNTHGNWTSSSTTSHSMSSSRMSLDIKIYSSTVCTATGTLLCHVAALVHLTSTFSSSLSYNSPFSITGSSVGSVMAFPSCSGGPSQILGTTLTLTSPITGAISW